MDWQLECKLIRSRDAFEEDYGDLGEIASYSVGSDFYHIPYDELEVKGTILEIKILDEDTRLKFYLDKINKYPPIKIDSSNSRQPINISISSSYHFTKVEKLN